MPDRERKGVPEHRSSVLKGSLPEGPSAILGTRKMRVSAADRIEREGKSIEMK